MTGTGAAALVVAVLISIAITVATVAVGKKILSAQPTAAGKRLGRYI